VASYSSSLFVANVAGQLQTKTDEVVIGINLPLINITPYSIARRLSEIPQILTDQFMRVLMPLASQLHAEDDRARLRSLYLTSTRLTLVSFIPLACGLVFLVRPFLTLWLGAPYADYSYLVVILTIASLIDTSQWPAGSILQGMALHRWIAVLSLASALINLGLSLWLVHPFKLAGVAIGTLIPTSIECLCFVLPYAVRRIGVSWRAVLTEVFLPSVVPAIPMAVILFSLVEFLHPDSYLLIGFVGFTGLAVYAIGYLMTGAAASERQILRQLFQSLARTARRISRGDEHTSY
jgi:O-antigen/teichoic acid export membrane protein